MITTGDRLDDRYLLGELLGEGGMAAVYRATDERLQRAVAVKVLPVVEGYRSERLRQEATVLARLDHPTLVRILDAGEHDEQPYIVMDLVEGRTLRDRLAEGALDEASVRSLAKEVAAGLVHAHAAGVVHRDLKPANLMLGGDGRVRIVDFGIARIVDATGLTATGTGVGTAGYLAPEQLLDAVDVGPATDVYTFGLVLLEALTGRRAFPGDGIEATLARLTADPAVPDDLPAPWPDLLRQMTARAPHERLTPTALLLALDPGQPAPDPTMTEADLALGELPTAAYSPFPESAGGNRDETAVDDGGGVPAVDDGGGGGGVPAVDGGGGGVAATARPAPPAHLRTQRRVRPALERAAAWIGANRRTATIVAGAVALALVVVGIGLANREDLVASPTTTTEVDADLIPDDVAEAIERLRATVAP